MKALTQPEVIKIVEGVFKTPDKAYLHPDSLNSYAAYQINYGQWEVWVNARNGEMLIAKRMVEHGKKSKRYNRNAALFQLLANLNWLCPSRDTRSLWNTWSDKRKKAINRAINKAVEDHEKEA